ncbi:MAG: type IV secretory system conjugative DNA transfer family protein [Beijerinckiaceae bacterium]|nr:type IV secretory system conjugative DNA transfer family protein [Beijerinckiaceae bacterium]
MVARIAFVNMLRAAWRDPLWALGCAVFGPLSAIHYVAKTGAIAGIVTLVLVFTVHLAMDAIGMAHTWLHLAGNLLACLLGLMTLARFVTKPMVEHFGMVDDDETHGSARFANDNEVSSLTRTQSGLLIGRDPITKKLLRYDGPAHLLTMAPTRTGKGVGTIIPNLLTLDRSIICVDPKGENAKVTARARDRFGKVHVLDPFGVTGIASSAFNPLQHLDPDDIDVAEEAATLADALVFDAPGEAGEAHWNEEAKALIGGIILTIAADEPRERRNLATLRECLTLAPEAFTALLKRMQASSAAGGLVARAANRHLGKSDREAAGVLSAAQRHTHFLDSPRMTAVLDRSDFSFADLKRRTATVFLVLPPDRLATYSRWLRLMVTRSLSDMARAPSPAPAGAPAASDAAAEPVLYLLDEFAALGNLAPVERAMGLMAGYGVQLWPILQDVHQLRATYGRRAGTFLSNAGVLQVFGVNDHDSARLVSDLTGQETVVFKTMSRALDSEKSGISYGQQHVARPLMTPDEVRNMPAEAQMLFIAGQRPIIAGKLRYFADHEFAGLF